MGLSLKPFFLTYTFVIVILFFHPVESKWVEETLDVSSTAYQYNYWYSWSRWVSIYIYTSAYLASEKNARYTSEKWEFLTRFCFMNIEKGSLSYWMEYPASYGVQKLLFYYDVPGSWEYVYPRRHDMTCQEKNNVANNNYFTLEPGINSNCKIIMEKGENWYHCEGDMPFKAARERWWFLVLSRCEDPQVAANKGRMFLRYKFHMTNGNDFLHKEYSADQFYIVVLNIVFFALYIKVMIISIICAFELKKQQLLHTTYKMYMLAIIIWTISLLCRLIAWTYYGGTGWELSSLDVTGRILQAASTIVFMLLLILLAKGYTIVRGKLTSKSAVKITVFISLYIVGTIALFIWEAVAFDPAIVLYYYESPPGYCMVVVFLIGWLWFTKAAVCTMKNYPGQTKFYIILYTFYTLWFWAGPIIILLAMFAMAKWTREKTVTGVQLFTAYLGHLVFLLLTLPSKVNTNFPYHVRTTQIASTGSDSDSPDSGAYRVTDDSQLMGTGPNLSFFITTKDVTHDTADGSRMYSALDHNSLGMREAEDSDSPPPSYQVMNSKPLPPLGTRPEDLNVAPSAPQEIPHREEPPHYELVGGVQAPHDTSQELPPLRGKGLGPIVPPSRIAETSMGIDNPAYNDTMANDTAYNDPTYNDPTYNDPTYNDPPHNAEEKDVSKMFQVSK